LSSQSQCPALHGTERLFTNSTATPAPLWTTLHSRFSQATILWQRLQSGAVFNRKLHWNGLLAALPCLVTSRSLSEIFLAAPSLSFHLSLSSAYPSPFGGEAAKNCDKTLVVYGVPRNRAGHPANLYASLIGFHPRQLKGPEGKLHRNGPTVRLCGIFFLFFCPGIARFNFNQNISPTPLRYLARAADRSNCGCWGGG